MPNMDGAARMPTTQTLPDAAAETAVPEFSAPHLAEWLASASNADLDALPFGLVAMTQDGIVEHYNRAESNLSSLTPARVVGRNFFTSVAPCANNAVVARRYASEPALDVVIDYVFTFRLAPANVRLRLLKRLGAQRTFLAVERRG
jgi:photoactive yellow protein